MGHPPATYHQLPARWHRIVTDLHGHTLIGPDHIRGMVASLHRTESALSAGDLYEAARNLAHAQILRARRTGRLPRIETPDDFWATWDQTREWAGILMEAAR